MLESLRTRSITGNRAREAIETCSQMFDSDEWNGLARRVLIKDLRCGISEKTINKVVGKTEWKIPVFSCQLAQDSTDQPKKLRGIKRLEVKLDGVRVLAVVNGSACTLYSRNGKEFENFPQIADFVEEHRKAFQRDSAFGGQFVLDGEIVGKNFQDLMKQTQRKRDAKTTDMVYHVFDILPGEDDGIKLSYFDFKDDFNKGEKVDGTEIGDMYHQLRKSFEQPTYHRYQKRTDDSRTMHSQR